MENVWDLLIQLVKHGTNTLHFDILSNYDISLFYVFKIDLRYFADLQALSVNSNNVQPLMVLLLFIDAEIKLFVQSIHRFNMLRVGTCCISCMVTLK